MMAKSIKLQYNNLLAGILLLSLLWSGTSSAEPGDLLFQSGFGSGTKIIKTSSRFLDIVGKDQSFSNRNDWQQDLERLAQVGAFRIQLDDSPDSARGALLLPDPADSSNQVLGFWLKGASNRKGRVQAQFYGSGEQHFSEVYYRVKLKLDASMQHLESFPNAIGWLTLMEFWNAPIGQEFPFRITLGLNKAAPTDHNTQPLYFALSAENYGQQGFNRIWEQEAIDVPVVFDQWITLEIFYRQGDEDSGRFWLAVTPAQGTTQVAFDIQNWTYNSTAPNAKGMSHFHPFKLYTGEDLINFMGSKGTELKVYWDDFSLWAGRPKAAPMAPNLQVSF